MEPVIQGNTLDEAREMSSSLYVYLSAVFIDTSSADAEYSQLQEICAKVAGVVMDIDKILQAKRGRTAARSGQ